MAIDKVLFLADGKQPIAEAAGTIAEFIRGAKKSVHIAIYDFRLKDADAIKKVVGALTEQAAHGIEVRIAYDHRNAPKFGLGDDPAPHGTHTFLTQHLAGSDVELQPVGWTDVQLESIAGSKLMHSKYIIRDGHTRQGAVLMGSANFTDDAWTHQENNIALIASPKLAAFYETDFNELWSTGNIVGTGVNDFGTIASSGLHLDVAFSPGEGKRVDDEIAKLILSAQTSIHIASMVITSDAIVAALAQVLEAGRVPIRGLFDGPEMASSVKQMKNSTKIEQIKELEQVLVAKKSKPFDPSHPDSLHNFMHNKLVVVDDAVLTGSHNFSLSAEHNAENAILFRNAKLAKDYRGYVESLLKLYG